MRARWRPAHALATLPLALIAAISIADALTGPDIQLGPLLVVAPAVTASFAGPRLTACISALAVAARIIVAILHGVLGTESRQAEIAALAAASTVVVIFTVLRDRHARVLKQVRSVSEAAQQVLLRPLPPRIGPLQIASVYLAAEAEAHIGGDLYAATRTDTSSRLLIGDVRGKGLAAVGDAALLLGAFHGAAHQQAALPALMTYLDASVRWGLDEDEECFITAALLDIPDHGRHIHLISCGHPPPLLLHDGTVIPLAHREPAPPLGLGEFADPDYPLDAFAFEDGDLLLLYTDGIIEARDDSGAFYPLAERLADWHGCAPDQLLERLREDVLAHVRGQLTDDAAAIAVTRVPRGQLPDRHRSPASRPQERMPDYAARITLRRRAAATRPPDGS
ncbi:PP2C family protein-serine/threonine phosphatase [Peterkaempfera bronchialis]|uniref:PP2C family protein-serine/threonine phosphatase n=1 Tax=Peterkaempfera bronchialis TaxID=2126346 RepID=UPI003C2E4275